MDGQMIVVHTLLHAQMVLQQLAALNIAAAAAATILDEGYQSVEFCQNSSFFQHKIIER